MIKNGHVGGGSPPPHTTRGGSMMSKPPGGAQESIFQTSVRFKKTADFSNRQERPKTMQSIEPWASRERFLIKKHDFRPPFLGRVFDFFRKLRKCEISEEYNAKRPSEPSKTSHFRIDFSSNFHVFSEPPPRGHF